MGWMLVMREREAPLVQEWDEVTGALERRVPPFSYESVIFHISPLSSFSPVILLFCIPTPGRKLTILAMNF